MFKISDPNATVLVELSTQGATKLFAFQPNEERGLTVGSDERAELRLTGLGVAPVQFHLERRGETICLIPAYGLEDLRVNTARVSGPLPLEERSVIEFADIRVDATIFEAGTRESLPSGDDTWSDRPARISEPPGEGDTTQLAMRALTPATASVRQQTTAMLRPIEAQVACPQQTERIAPYRPQASPLFGPQPIPMQSTERMAPVPRAANNPSFSPAFTTLGTEIMAPVRSTVNEDPDSPPPTLRARRLAPVTVAPVARSPLKTLSFHPLKLEHSQSVSRTPPINDKAAPAPLSTESIVPVPVVAVTTAAPMNGETSPPFAGQGSDSSTTLFEVPAVPTEQRFAYSHRSEATPTAVDVRSPIPQRPPDETPSGVVKAGQVAAGALSWLAKLGLLAKARPVLVACSATAGAFVLAAALLVSTRLLERREPRMPAATEALATHSLALTHAAVAAPPTTPTPVQIIEASAASPASSATRSPAAKKTPNDPERAAAVADLVAGRYSEAHVAYGALSQRTTNAAAYASLARLLARAEDPACAANSQGAPRDCPGVQR